MESTCGMCQDLKFQFGANPDENYSICQKFQNTNKRPETLSCLDFNENTKSHKIGYMKVKILNKKESY